MKKLLALVLVMIPACIGITITSSSKTPKSTVQTEQQRQQKRQQKNERSRAVYRGLLNPHSEKIPDLARMSKGDVWIEKDIGLLLLNPNPKAAFSLKEFLGSRACDADAIVIGTVKRQTSRLTEDESFIYTINDLEVGTVVKDNSTGSIKSNEVLHAIRSGGRLELDGKKITAVFKGALPLEVSQTYLLFLTFIPEKGFYVADNISYQIKNDKIVKLTTQQLEKEVESGNSADAFVSSVRSVIAVPCETLGGE